MLLSRTLKLLALGALALLTAAQKPYPITGVSVDPRSGSVPLRKNINELHAVGGAQWDLYIRAMKAMYDMNSDDPLSFFQIAGIHGRPFVEWNGGGEKNTNGWQGYCPHGEKLFLPWHRPFVLLYEQLLVEHATRLANEYPRRYRYQYIRAAQTLRAPYWDWAEDSDVPPATVPLKMKVNVPNGEALKTINIDNPLATFRFPKVALSGKYGPFDSQKRNQTIRCPAPSSYPLSANLKMSKRPYKSWVYDAFTHSKNFAEFSSTADSGASLEQIHNGVHWDGACGSQLLSAELSAFDPLFMLHHCNIDRLWAYWQAMRPKDSLFYNPYPGGARFSTPRGTSIGPRSPLNPFYTASGELHTSKSVEKLQGLGYSYQGLEYWSKTAAQMQQDATRLTNRMYADNSTISKRSMTSDGGTMRYFARVQLEVSQVERPCSINLFVNGQRVGSLVVMQQPEYGIVHGGFDLDQAAQPAQNRGVSTDMVVSSMQSGLEVEIVTLDGKNIPVKSVPSLKFELEDVPVTPPSSEIELPSYGRPRTRPAKVVEKGGLPIS